MSAATDQETSSLEPEHGMKVPRRLASFAAPSSRIAEGMQYEVLLHLLLLLLLLLLWLCALFALSFDGKTQISHCMLLCY